MRKGFLLGMILLCIGACTRMAPEFESNNNNGGPSDCTPQFPDKQVTYEGYVKNVIARYCTPTCHKGGNSEGIGDFRTYAGLKPHANDNFYYRVIQNNADMPQGKAPLPKAIRDSLNYWLRNCIPEN